ncbi:MAG: ABC transporter permease subunit, partial [Anaeroplasmataceae bacterium]|nr:ABC transporter permease subunit [Anaeroplasmataceae bacterium]
ILPIYTVLEKIEYSYVEASYDLGASPIKSFFKITFPLSLKGVISGIMMVFLPAAMGFTIPQIVTNGDPKYKMVGQLIESRFKSSHPFFNIGSIWSLIIVIFVLGSLYVLSRIDEEGETLL